VVPDKAKILSLKCPICEKSFSCMSALKRHTRDTCNDEKKVYALKCDGCDTTLIRTRDLKRHQQKRDNPNGSAKFLCTICDKKLCNRMLLMVHIKKEHVATIEKSSNAVKVLNERRGVEETETFECEFCGNRFEMEDSAMQHKVTHKVVEKIQCEKCQTKFSLRKSYKRHHKEAL
jgi:uncharacterized Zn-finger protein